MTVVIPTPSPADDDDMWAGMSDTLPAPPSLTTAEDSPFGATPEGRIWAEQENAARLAAFDQRIAEQIERRAIREYITIRAREAAKERRAAELGEAIEIPKLISLDALLAEPDEPTRWRVDNLWPVARDRKSVV